MAYLDIGQVLVVILTISKSIDNAYKYILMNKKVFYLYFSILPMLNTYVRFGNNNI